MSKSMHSLKLSLCVIVSLLLVGCAAPTPKVPHVKMEVVSYVVTFEDGSTKIHPYEQEPLQNFINTIPATAVSFVGLATDDANPHALARARTIRHYLIRQGFDAKLIHLQPIPGNDPLIVAINIEYAMGVPPAPCPDWSKNSAMDYEVTDASNFGCAYGNNLISQMANPADYNGGHSKTVFDGTRDSVAVQRYFSGTTSATAGSAPASAATTTTTTSSP